MRATTLLLSAALTLCATTSFAQSSYNRVVEPVSQSVDAIINAPIEYDNNGVMKAQYFNVDDLTEEEYQQVLAEAGRIRSYRDANGLNFEDDYVAIEQPSYVSPTTVTATQSPSYQVELFAPETTYAATTYAETSYTTSSAKLHTISKGDTLYNISKRYDTTVPAIQAENGISGTELSIGQQIRIPGVMVESYNTAASLPVYASSTSNQNYISSYVVEPAPELSRPQIETAFSSERTYAVLPKDTLYKISRFTCVDVKDIISRNGITNPDNLSPGDMLTLPEGHCLSR